MYKSIPEEYLLLFFGCALPDLQPFADSTAQLHTAVLQSTTAVQLTLLKAGASDAAEQLGHEIAVRVIAMQAIVRYTDALSHIAEAGRMGGENAGNVANALQGFLDALSADPLPTKYIAIAKSLYGVVAQVRAARSFSQAVTQADPAIQGIAEILIADFADLENLLATARVPIRDQLLQQDHHAALVDYRQTLERRRRQLEQEIGSSLVQTEQIAALQEVNQLIDLTRDRYEPLMAELQAINNRIAIQINLIQKAREGIRQWAAIHSTLAVSVQNGFPPNTRLLTATVLEIRELLREERTP